MRVFRDDSNLSVDPGLWTSIRRALTQSEYFLLLASPDAASSPWIARETSYWLKNRSPQKLLIVLTDGKLAWNNAVNDFDWEETNTLPENLRGAFSEEPLYLDFRGFKTQEDLSLQNPAFRERIASITATLKQRPKDELIGEDVRQHQRTKRLTVAVGALLMAFLVIALFQWRRAVLRAAESHSHALAISAQQALGNADTDLALRLAIEANKIPNAPPLAKRILRQVAYYNPGTRKVFKGHKGAVTSVSASPDGRYGVSGSEDMTIIVWDLNTGEERRRFKGHGGTVTRVAFSADGRRVLSASEDTTIRLWDIGSTKSILTINGHEKSVNDAIFGPREQTIISASSDQTIRIWRVADGIELKRTAGETGAVLAVALSPDGKSVIYGTQNNEVCLWRFATEDLPSCKKDYQSHSIYDVAISEDGTRVFSAAGGWDCGVLTWNILGDHLQTEEIQCYEKHDGGHHSIALHPKYRLLITGSDDSSIVLWRTKASWRSKPGSVMRRFLGHNGQVNSVAFLPGGRRFLSGSIDKTVRLWDLTSSAEVKRFDSFDPNGFVLSADGRSALIASRDDTKLRHVDMDSETISPLPVQLPYRAGPIVLHPDGTTALLAAGFRLMLVDVSTGEIIRIFKGGHNTTITSIAFTPDGNGVLTGAYANKSGLSKHRYMNVLIYWDVHTGSILHRLIGHSDNVRAVATSPDGRLAASGGDDNKLIFWDLANGRRLGVLPGHGDSVQAISFSPDSRFLITGARDHILRLWSVQNKTLIREYRGHTGGIHSLAVSPNGRLLLSGSEDGTLRSWDMDSGSEIALVSGLDDLGTVREIAFTPDGSMAYTRSWDHTVRLWRIEPPENIMAWTYANRHVRELFPNEIDRFRIGDY